MSTERKAPPFRRWLNVVLRGAHLVAVICLGAALLGAPVNTGQAAFSVAATGFAMFATDTWGRPAHLREVAGLAVIAKLLLVGWMALDPLARPVLFWIIVAGSAFSAHAPARFRHRRVWGRVL